VIAKSGFRRGCGKLVRAPPSKEPRRARLAPLDALVGLLGIVVGVLLGGGVQLITSQ
jgi:hypothetical protein